MTVQKTLEKYGIQAHGKEIALGYENGWPYSGVDMRSLKNELDQFRTGKSETRKVGRCIYEYRVELADGFFMTWGCDSSD